jgi:hypothetical protein
MSDLDYLDVFQMFLRELETRNFDPQTRAVLLQEVRVHIATGPKSRWLRAISAACPRIPCAHSCVDASV